MSQENVEIVRATIASINGGDLDQALEAAHEDFIEVDEARVVVRQSKADALEAVGLAHP